jgi:hypothetical protein
MTGINRHLHEVSKDEASRLRRETAKRHAVNKYTFQSMPWPIKEDWNHIETLHPLVLELSYADVKLILIYMLDSNLAFVIFSTGAGCTIER